MRLLIQVFVSCALCLIAKSRGWKNDYQTADACHGDGESVRCDGHSIVNIHSIVCGADGHGCTPATKATINNLCNGQKSCGGLGLKNVLSDYCNDTHDAVRQVHVTFTCVPGQMTKCKSNICDESSPGVRCESGSVVHFTKVSCYDGIPTCSWSTFVTLYSLCEGQRSCAASGLRTLMPNYCTTNIVALRNVIVEFVCLPESLIAKKCTGSYKELTNRFGVIMNPGYTDGNGALSGQCYWLIKIGKGQRTKVIIHLAYSKKGMPNCTSQFLQIRYKECLRGKSRIESYCDLRKVNQELVSCGDVYITSFLPSSMEDLSDQFLLSYTIYNDTSMPGEISAEDIRVCGATPTPRATASWMTSSLPPSSVSDKNYIPKESLVVKPKDDTNTGADIAVIENRAGPAEITLKFKLVILYIFFGIVIAALLLALIFVIMSYRRIASKGKYEVESNSEKAVLWKSESTQMDTFRHNSIAELSASGQLDTTATTTTTMDSSQNNHTDTRHIATIHVPSASEREKRRSGESLQGDNPHNCIYEDPFMSDPYATYSSIHDDPPRKKLNRNFQERNSQDMNGRPPTRDRSSPREGDRNSIHPLTTASPGDVEHYKVNDDDYAIVRKSRKSNGKIYNPVEDDPTYDNLFDEELIGFRPTSGPYDKNRNSGMNLNIRLSALDAWDDEL